MKVGIGFVTGRKGFRNLLRTYINNWNEHGLIEDKSILIQLFIAYDLKYHKTNINDYKNIPSELIKLIDGINYYGVNKIKEESKILVNNGVLTLKEADLLFGSGYGKKRNAVLYAAIRNGMDALLFIDDDEYPIASCVHNKLCWMGQGVVSTHLKHINDCDITHGRHCGYISPIPFIEFSEKLPEKVFKKFIIALSNDIISWDSVKNTMIQNNGVTYADMDILMNQPIFEVQEEHGMKFISGANLCFNLNKINSIAPFYNPPGARGEDTFLSTCLSKNKVIRVPCYTFHDGFLFYKNILNGVLPVELSPITANSKIIINRFVNASRGWMRYKPLLTYITKNKDYDSIMKEIKESLDISIPFMCDFFKTQEFDKIFSDFDIYQKNVRLHYDTFEKTKIAWAKAVTWAQLNKYNR
ncbi:MAG: hypothetical protein HUU50_06745 [Candidatus Brocadiae bacterium]|nr:hypothetical protein [Candidatus Brocadiia bacterium]